MPCPSILSQIRSRAAVCLLAALVITPVAPTAQARATEDDENVDQVAREHYRRGEVAFKAGRFDQAYREWEEGYRISSRPLFLVNMAHAQRRRGDLRNARALYQRFLLVEPQTKMRRELETVIREIDSTLSVEPGRRPPAARAAGSATESSDAPSADVEGSAALAPPALGTTTTAGATTTATPPAAAEAPAVVPPPVAAPPVPLGRVSLSPPPDPPSLFDRPREDVRIASPPPIYKRWWFWAGAAGVVAAGVAAVLWLRPDPYTRNGSLGTIGTVP
jgi:hypothetical protein